MSIKSVLVFGGTSYVGHAVLRELLNRGLDVYAAVRSPAIASVLLNDLSGLHVVTVDQLEAPRGQGPIAIVNLAYVKEATPHRIYKENARLISGVLAAVRSWNASRLIQTSTIAVLGNSQKLRPGPVRRPPIGWYSETKWQAERLLMARAPKTCNTVVLRLGNVIGPGSALWTAGVAQAILEGARFPSAIEATPSNTTYLDNAASYLAHLASTDAEDLTEFGPYHQLVEFGDHTWAEIIQPLASAIGAPLLMGGGHPPQRKSANFIELSLSALRRAYGGGAGRYIRDILGRTPDWSDSLFTDLRSRGDLWRHVVEPEVTADQSTMLVDATRRLNWVLPTWMPSKSFDEAMDDIAGWLAVAGYRLEPVPPPQ